MHRHRHVMIVRDARICFQRMRSLQREALVMRDSVDMDDIVAQCAARIFVRNVMFSYTMYCTSVLVVGCDRSCALATLVVCRSYVLLGVININSLMAFIMFLRLKN